MKIQTYSSVMMVIACIIATSCNKKDDNVSLTNAYLPLETGNYWQLDYLDKTEVVGTKNMNNKVYYLLQYQNDTSYYRIENNKVYVIGNESNEAVKFNLSAKVNDTWNFYSYTVKLVSKTDTVTINNTKIKNCYQFYFDIPGMVDDEHSIWLAPGIGFVQQQCGECLHFIQKLDKAKIGNQVIDY